MTSKGYRALNKSLVYTLNGIRKLDFVAIKGDKSIAVDAQVIGEQTDLNAAHRNKITYYSKYKEEIKTNQYERGIIFIGDFVLEGTVVGPFSKSARHPSDFSRRH